MSPLANKFRDRIHSAFYNVGRKLREVSSNTPRGVATSHIKHNRDSYKCGGFKNRH